MSGHAKARRPEPAELHEAIRTLDTIAEVAAYFGVDRSTVFAWQRRPEWHQYLDGLQAATYSKIRAEVEQDLRRVTRRARKLVDDEDADPHASLNAARLLREVHADAARVLPSASSAEAPDREGLVSKIAQLLGGKGS